MNTKTIQIAKDFSAFPAGRYRSDGNNSGQVFREDFLVPALQGYEQVIVNLDGTIGLGSSFLEEAFGGLVRECPFSLEQLRKKLKIQSSLESYADEIWDYISQAKRL